VRRAPLFEGDACDLTEELDGVGLPRLENSTNLKLGSGQSSFETKLRIAVDPRKTGVLCFGLKE